MPELPDLEIYRENLQPLVIGKQIASVSILYPKTMQLISEEDFIRAVSGATLTSIRRLGKRLLFGLDTGEGCGWMAVHLMMYGEIRYGIDVSSAVKGLRVCLRFTSGDELVFLDMSAWTKIGYYSEDGSIGQGMQRRLAMLGHEPLDADLTPEVLRRLFAGETKTVKECLMDHKLIIGIGNAYSDEILWQAGIAPMRQAASLSPEGLHGLRSAMQTVLVEAIDKVRIGLQGQTYGEVRDFLHVHSRPKKKQCDRCGGLIERVEIKTRGSYFCPRCQK